MEKFSWVSDKGCRLLLDQLHDGVFVVDEALLIYANPYLATMLGYTVDELIGRSFVELIASEDRPLVWEKQRARLAGEKVPEQYEVNLLTAQGTLVYCALNVSLQQSPEGRAVLMGSARDVTQKKAEMANLEASRIELQSIYQQLPDVFYRTDMQGIVTMISPSCLDIIGYSREEMLGTPLSSYYVSPEDRQRVLQAIREGEGRAKRVEAALRHKDGSVVWISTNAFIRFDAMQQPVSVDGVARDISERKQLEEQLTLLSRTDDLTGAYNRRYFMEKSEEMISLSKRYQRPASLMLADMDHFKNINDQYGHQAGDQVLLAFINTCREEIREQDVLGRLGGEEFALFLPETTQEQAQQLVERIRKATAAIEIAFNGEVIKVTVSIGLVEIHPAHDTLRSAMHRADMAMYQAKENGRNRVVVAQA